MDESKTLEHGDPPGTILTQFLVPIPAVHVLRGEIAVLVLEVHAI